MAIDDPYATWAQYKATQDALSDSQKEETELVILAVSRLFERQLGSDAHPRVFNASAAGVVRHYNGNGRGKLLIDDLTTLASLEVDTSDNGTYDTTITGALEIPHNAAELSRPFTHLQLRPSNATSTFPRGLKSVKVTGVWGWPAVPDAIREATIMVTRQLRDLQKAGASMQLANVDQQVQQTPGWASLLRDLKAKYASPWAVPGIA